MKKMKGILTVVAFAAAFVYGAMIQQWHAWQVILLLLAVLVVVILINIHSVILFMANAYHRSGQKENAVKLYKFEIRHTKRPLPYLNYAVILVRDGEAAQAVELINKALTFKPDVLTHKSLILTLGSCYWVLGDVPKAIETLEGLRKNYEYVNASALTTLGYLYLLQDDTEKALDCTNLAIQDSPESGSAWDNLGQIYFTQGKLDEAKEAFLKALGFNASLPDSYYYLALIAEKEGDLDSARAYLEKAQECNITSLNTVTKEQIETKLSEISTH